MNIPLSRAPLALLALLLLSFAAPAAEPQPAPAGPWLFTSFRGNGEDGLHLAASRDGYTWTALRNDRSFLKPNVGGKLMRDPSLAPGPDNRYHMVWTTGWWDKGFGYASSADLLTWSPQRYVPINENTPGAKNTWAPELFYDRATESWLIVWATTITGKFPETENQGEHNHRLYYTSTKDFNTFTPAALFYDPGFNCIDGTIVQDGQQYILVFKDERRGQKCLRIARAPRPQGPWSPPSQPISGDWVEGPSILRIGDQWHVYFDHYTNPHYYGALRSADGSRWTDVSKQMSFPRDFRHGTALPISQPLLRQLESSTPAAEPAPTR